MQVGNLFSIAVQGIQNQMDAMNGAAEQVLVASAAPSGGDTVSISAGAKQAASGGGAQTDGLVSGMNDLRISKYLAVANMKVVQTGEDMTQDLTNMIGSSGG
jgi:hypothetical protein